MRFQHHYVVGRLGWDGMICDSTGIHSDEVKHIDDWGAEGWRVVSLETRVDGTMVVLEKAGTYGTVEEILTQMSGELHDISELLHQRMR